MNRFYKIIVILILSFTNITCSEDETIKLSSDNYLIFGHFYGFCTGEECVQTYKLTSTKLYEGLADDYNHETYNFKALSDEKFNIAIDLLSFLPAELLAEKENFIGCPDCADQGGIYIEYKNGDSTQSWWIDQNRSQIPEYLHSFINKVNEKINTINY